MGNIVLSCGGIRKNERGETIREYRTGQKWIEKPKQIDKTMANIAESCTNTKVTDTPVSHAVATKEKTKIQTEEKFTSERERLSLLETCLKRHKTKIDEMFTEQKKMIESLLPFENLNEAETSESLSETNDNSEKTKLLLDLTDLEEIQKQLLDSCEGIKQCSSQMFDEISKCLEGARRKKYIKEKVTIQFFNVQNGEPMVKIKETLKKYLDDRLENVHFKNCYSPDDILDNHLLIIPCIIGTRLGDDAAYAIKNIPNPGNTVLVLIHYKLSHALQEQKSSLILDEQNFKKIREILDLAFMIDTGFYSCRMNFENLDRLCKVCKEILGERL